MNVSYDLTDHIAAALVAAKARDGLVTVFAHGSTIALTVMRDEPGTTQDLHRVLDRIAPDDGAPCMTSRRRSEPLLERVFIRHRDKRCGAMANRELGMCSTHRVVLIDFGLHPAKRRALLD